MLALGPVISSSVTLCAALTVSFPQASVTCRYTSKSSVHPTFVFSNSTVAAALYPAVPIGIPSLLTKKVSAPPQASVLEPSWISPAETVALQSILTA